MVHSNYAPHPLFLPFLLVLISTTHVPLITATATTTAACSGSRTYSVTMNYQWTPAIFPSAFPSNAHFSPLVVFSHSSLFSAFSMYGYATRGVQDVAETGSFSLLRSELEAARAEGMVGDIQIDTTMPGPSGSAGVTLEVNCDFPFISAVSMVAPSPDWIVPVFRFATLRRKNGKYKKRGMRQLDVWDAGTDAGKTLTARNRKSKPKENIHPVQGTDFDGKTIAVFRVAVKM